MNYTSPNFDDRNAKIEHVILHYTDMETDQEAIDILCDPASRVSSHYVIGKDGSIYNLVAEEKRTWHAGISFWRGKENLNASSIGIEISNPGHRCGYVPFTKAQYDAIIPLCQRIKKQYNILDVNIIGHSDVAPDRKMDPGELFDWKLLAENGLGILPSQLSISSSQDSDLIKLGYKTADSKAIAAFQRHWRQSKVDGIWDDECSRILTGLLTQLG